MTKIFILGLDGLEYELVKRWSLSNLMQKEYGRIEVPISEKTGMPESPQVWASFLTGKEMDVHFESPKPMKIAENFLIKPLSFIRKFIPLKLGLSKRIRSLVVRRTKILRGFPELNERTFLDMTDSIAINAPFHNYDHKEFEILTMLGTEKVSLSECIDEMRLLYMERKADILIKPYKPAYAKAKLIFAYMIFPDALQHLLFFRPEEIEMLYRDLDIFVSEVKKQKYDFFLIVSDHGFELKTGNHSLHGFYSSNRPLDPQPRRITDFYPKILEWGKKRK
jgi:hypothetical protein